MINNIELLENPTSDKIIKINKNNQSIQSKNLFSSEDGRKQFKKIILEKYGVENPSQSKEIQEKRAESMRIMFEKKGVVMKRYKYDNLLDFCKKNNIVLLNDFSVIKLNKNTRIKSKCLNCTDGICEKSFCYFIVLPLCPNCTAEKRLKTLEENNMKKYGVKHVSMIKEVREKTKQTNLQKYGVENPSQNKDVHMKKENTMMKNYGTKYLFQNKEQYNIFRNNFLLKHGVENPSQVPEIAEKQNKRGFQIKEYILPSGKKLTYQGYEHFVLDKLINENKIDEKDIETSKKTVPELWYDYEGKRKRHFVDIYIKSRKICIEVKSIWTLKKHYDKVFAKQKFAKKQGYRYYILVVSSKGEILEQYK
jgi:hypothetical protein